MIDFQQCFENFLSIGNQQKKIAVDSAVGVYFGLSNDGFLRLSFLSKAEAPRLESTKALRVTQGEEAVGVFWTCFDLVNNEAKSVFYTFCANMANAVSGIKSEPQALTALKKRYIAWKSMFKGIPNSNVSKEVVQGLFGELFFLKNYVIGKHGINAAINGWSGPDSKSKDFSVDNEWYEVKTVGANTASVHISSLAQLSSQYDGHLVVVKVESMSREFENGEACIGDLFSAILSQITDETIENVFLSKISAFGFELSDSCMSEKFNVKSLDKHKVDADFPRITENDIKRQEICDVSYSLILSTLKTYLEE